MRELKARALLCVFFFWTLRLELFSYISYLLALLSLFCSLLHVVPNSIKTSYDHSYTLIPLLVSIPDYSHTLQSISLPTSSLLHIWRSTLRPSLTHAGRVISILRPHPSTFLSRNSEVLQMIHIHRPPPTSLILLPPTPFRSSR